MAALSVIICSHNPRPDYLRRTLNALQGQTLPVDQWEMLFIDNASERPLAEIWDISWHPRGRHVREDELGLTPARLRGIVESRGDILVFVDDDNVLGPDFLKQVTFIRSHYPRLGVYGAGSIEPEFEIQPSPEFDTRLSLLALRTVPSALWTNNIRDSNCIPWGAGLCVSRKVANHYREVVAQLNMATILDRRGKQLFSGGDDLFSWASVAAGQGFGLFPELRIKHLIPAGRLQRQYFVRLVHDSAFSNSVLHYLLTGSNAQRVNLLRFFHLLLHGIRNGWFSMRCQWAWSQGQDQAARFISSNKLQAVEPTLRPLITNF